MKSTNLPKITFFHRAGEFWKLYTALHSQKYAHDFLTNNGVVLEAHLTIHSREAKSLQLNSHSNTSAGLEALLCRKKSYLHNLTLQYWLSPWSSFQLSMKAKSSKLTSHSSTGKACEAHLSYAATKNVRMTSYIARMANTCAHRFRRSHHVL